MKKILIIDDEKNIRNTLSKALTSEDYEVQTAMNGEEGVQKVRENDYDLILLDFKLPGISGMEVLKKIKDYDGAVIMITGYGSVDTAVEAMKMGAIDYLQKPFSPSEIRELVAEVLERKQLDIDGSEGKEISRETCLRFAKKLINERNFSEARKYLEKAVAEDPNDPEIFNLLGVIYEFGGDENLAMKNYRTAVSLEPTYEPARDNLNRISEFSHSRKGINLGEEEEEQQQQEKES
ncbi:MAG: response regulator [bacterium]